MGHGPEKNQEMKKGAADKIGPITSSCPGKESVFLSLFGECLGTGPERKAKKISDRRRCGRVGRGDYLNTGV